MKKTSIKAKVIMMTGKSRTKESERQAWGEWFYLHAGQILKGTAATGVTVTLGALTYLALGGKGTEEKTGPIIEELDADGKPIVSTALVDMIAESALDIAFSDVSEIHTETSSRYLRGETSSAMSASDESPATSAFDATEDDDLDIDFPKAEKPIASSAETALTLSTPRRQLTYTTPAKVGLEFLVNTYTTNDQVYSAIASFSDGTFVITWQSNGQDGSGYGIYAQRFNADGSKLGSEFLVNTYMTNAQTNSAIAPFSNGTFVITWSSDGQDGSDYGIYAQRFNADGSKLGTEFLVNTYTTNEQMSPVIAPFSDGTFVITWQSRDQDGSGRGIYAQRFNADGSKLGTEFLVNTYTTREQQIPAIASFSDGTFVITWQSGQNPYYEIYAQRFNADGSKLGTEFLVNTYTPNEQVYPKIAPFSDGTFVITWSSRYQEGGTDHGVYAQRFNADGSKLGTEFLVNTYTTNYQTLPAIAPFSDGTFVITWQSRSQESAKDDYGIYAQRFTTSLAFVYNQLTIVEGQSLVVTSSMLSTVSSGYDDTVIVYTILNIAHAEFELTTNPGVAITTFNQAQVNAGLIKFIHDGGEIAPTLTYSVTDGVTTKSGIVTDVTFSNENDAPTITQKTIAIVEGETLVLTSSMLSATDIEGTPAAGIIFTVFNVQHAKFELTTNPGVSMTSFTQEQINTGQVIVIHDDGEVAPAFDFTVTDGTTAITSTSAIIEFTHVDDAPTIVTDTIVIDEGASIILTPSMLQITDPDTLADSLVYTISNLHHAKFELVTNPDIEIMSFTQEQINTRQVKFVHDGSAFAPSFKLAVSDGTTSLSPITPAIDFKKNAAGTSADKTTETSSATNAVLGSIGGALLAGITGLGFWKYKNDKDADRRCQGYPLANRIRKLLNLDVRDFETDKGIEFVRIVKSIEDILKERHAIDTSKMIRESLDITASCLVEAIRGCIPLHAPKVRFFCQTSLNIKELVHNLDHITNEAAPKIKGSMGIVSPLMEIELSVLVAAKL